MSALVQIFIIAVGLSADAVSVSVATSMRSRTRTLKEALMLALSFGIFQAGMPVIGYLVGASISGAVSGVGKWIACVLLGGIGLKMIFDSRDRREGKNKSLTLRELLFLSFATSIDALIVGTSIKLLDLSLVNTVVIVGIVTTVLCFVAYYAGKIIGKLFRNNVESVGGIVLIAIAISFLFR